MRTTSFVVLVPVKPPAIGKSRLVGLPGERRRGLAEAFARDTTRAALAARGVEAVLAVTDDHRLAGLLADQGCEVLPDGVTGDLNASLVQAAAEARRRWPHLRPAVLCADLPSLRPDELADALDRVRDRAPDGAAFVPDLAGTGTTLYTAPHEAFAPRFGAGSAAAHEDDGAVRLEAAEGLRRDVDDVDDLDAALAAGVGPRTAAALGND